MENLKWYDFLGALILLFSVTKSAIKPPETVDSSRTLPSYSAPRTIAIDSFKSAPREAALSQIDSFYDATGGKFLGSTSIQDVQDEGMGTRFGSVEDIAKSPMAKSIPKVAPRLDTHPEGNGINMRGFRSHESSPVPAFTY